ncbi:MAG: adventurous gliding motility lipoprotein CglB [Cystobacterineae bacterium]|nr:adventurous gliding motility lipoprotein CglB [Cystobacterineae bacterium]
MKAIVFPFLGVLALAACQTYDFEPVKPLAVGQTTEEIDLKAKPLPPNVMLLLDTSGSMNDVVKEDEDIDGRKVPSCDSTLKVCGSKYNSIECPLHCSTRINELRSAMDEFLENSLGDGEDSPPLGKFDLALFPAGKGTNKACDAPQRTEVGFTTSDQYGDLRANINKVRKVIADLHNFKKEDDVLPIFGGTPTGQSLLYLRDNIPEFESAAEDTSRRNFIVLLTDGLPNCNLATRDCSAANQCICTTNSSGLCEAKSSCKNLLNCLNQNETVEAIDSLRQNGVITFVIGFGVDTSHDSKAKDVLNQMAVAGGHPNTCAGCPNYYPAQNKTELLAVLEKLSKAIDPNPCSFPLKGANVPADPNLLSVYVDNERVAPGPNTYVYNPDNTTIEAQGPLCDRLKASSDVHPVPIRISVLKKM